MPILIILTVAVQAFFIYHVIRTKRPYWWAFIILSFPVAGSLIYYFVEVFPASREHRSARRVVKNIVRAAKPDAELQRRAEELEICGSMDNKLALAAECKAVGMYGEAANLYRSCLQGAYANDQRIVFLLAYASLMAGNLDEVSTMLNKLAAEHATFKPLEVKLLQARLLEQQGNQAAALSIYEELVPLYRGLEAKCRYAALLKAMGQTEQANQLLQEVIQHVKRFNIQHEAELEWASFAKGELRH